MANCRKYEVAFSNTPPAASTTIPIVGINGSAAVRLRVYGIELGSDTAPANASGSYRISTITTALGSGTGVTPTPMDSGDPASVSTAMQGPSIAAPTITTVKWNGALNQNNTLQRFFPDGYELTFAATANAGCCLLPATIAGTAFNVVGSLFFTE